MTARRLRPFLAALGCVAAGALAASAGCNGTGTTPICTFADGGNDPACGVLIEASAEGAVTAPIDAGSTMDATSPHVIDGGGAD